MPASSSKPTSSASANSVPTARGSQDADRQSLVPPPLDNKGVLTKEEKKDWEFALSEFGPHVGAAHILFMRWLPLVPSSGNLDVGNKDKLRLLIITQYRVAIAKKATFGGVAKRKLVHAPAHLFDLVEVQSPAPETVGFRFTRWSAAFHSIGLGDEIVPLIQRLVVNITAHFPADFLPSFVVSPAGRLRPLEIPDGYYGRDEGFLATYRAATDSCLGPQARPSTAFAHHVTMFSLVPVDRIEHRDASAVDRGIVHELLLHECAGIEAGTPHTFSLEPIARALRHTPLFQAVELCNVRRRENAVALLADAVATNPYIERLVISGTNCSSGFDELGYALKTNRALKLTHIDLSGNMIGDKGIEIAAGIAQMHCGLRVLRLARSQLSPAAASAICNALQANSDGAGTTIEELDLCDNDLREEGSSALATWIHSLSSACALRILLLARTKLDTSPVLRAVERSLSKRLLCLSLAGNNLSAVTSKINGPLERFLNAACELKSVDLSACELDHDGVSRTLGAIAGNARLYDLTLIMSGNHFGPRSAIQIADVVRGPLEDPCTVKSFARLDLVDARFGDRGLPGLLRSLVGCKLRHLSIGGEQKLTHRGKKEVGEAAAVLISSSTLETLSLAHLDLGSALVPVFASLCESKLRDLDITGNAIGDVVAFSLAAALSEDPSLRTVRFDENGLNIGGWQALRSALESNSTVLEISPPDHDVERAVRASTNKEAARAKIQELITGMLERANVNRARRIRRERRRRQHSRTIGIPS